MARYTQRPIEINAVKYDGTSDSYKQILREVDRYRGRVKRHIDATIFVRCFDGTLKIAKKNDYVVQHVGGDLNVIDEYNFEREYTYVAENNETELDILLKEEK